jgi:thioredoxin-related protein
MMKTCFIRRYLWAITFILGIAVILRADDVDVFTSVSVSEGESPDSEEESSEEGDEGEGQEAGKAKEDWPFEWVADFGGAQALAAKRNRPILLVFSGSDWCGWCQKLDSEVFQKPEFKEYVRNRFVTVLLDTPQKMLASQPHKVVMAKYQVTGYPAVIITDKDGKMLGKGGYLPGGPGAFISFLSRFAMPAKRAVNEKPEFDRSPESILLALARKMEMGDSAKLTGMEQLYMDVKLGNWPSVKKYLGSLKAPEAKVIFNKLLKTLQTTRMVKSRRSTMKRLVSVLTLEDFFQVCDCYPGEIGPVEMGSLTKLLKTILMSGNCQPALLEKLEKGTARFGGPSDEKKRFAAAKLLFSVGMILEAGKYMPDPKLAMEQKDIETVKMHINYLAEKARKEKDESALEQAWVLGQWLLLEERADRQERQAAFSLTLSLIPTLDEAVASKWLEERFKSNPLLGMSILTAVCNAIEEGSKIPDIKARQINLGMLSTVVKSLLKVTKDNTWDEALNALAFCWMMEAENSAANYMPPRRNNRYGFRYDGDERGDGESSPCLPIKDVLNVAPNPEWIARLKGDTKVQVLSLKANLCLKGDDLEGAMAAIKTLASINPVYCSGLIKDYLRAWSTEANNSPVEMDSRMQMMIRMGYHFGGSSMYQDGIPLTRARQVRNLAKLADLYKDIQAMTSEPVDVETAVSVFSECHSKAEIFLKQDIERVFGPFKDLSSSLRIELVSVMRARLSDSWGNPETQKQAQTNRSESQLQAELSRGYRILEELLQSGKDENDWQYHRLKAMVMYDSAEYYYSLKDKKDADKTKQYSLAEYIRQRDAALDSFRQSALCYSKVAPTLNASKRSVLVYLHWFYVTLGGSDLAHLKRSSDYNRDFLADIRKAIISLPKGLAEEHLQSFGDNIKEVSSQVGPEIKMRFLKAALEILQDHPSGSEARKLLNYYDELLGELKLVVRVDSDAPGAVVGHTRPFGLFIELKHTRNIERESGGFGRYLQDLNGARFGREGNVDHREIFRKYIVEALKENFQMEQLIFADPSVTSRLLPASDWSVTPLAYCVVKVKDKSIDKVPPIQLDMDFSDTKGKVVLPILSDILPIDARTEPLPAQVNDLVVKQVLDDRDYAKGKIKLQIDATANAMIPAFEELFDLTTEGFSLEGKIADFDRGLVIDKLDTESVRLSPKCQRSWELSFVIPKDKSITFNFPVIKPHFKGVKVTTKRYEDADIVEAPAHVMIKVDQVNKKVYLYGLLGVLPLGLAAWLLRRFRKKETEEVVSHRLPETLTAFTLINYLRHLEADTTLAFSEQERQALHQDIERIEKAYFSPDAKSEQSVKPDLQQILANYKKG